jgi:pimeloyl-ACP methyl ester carboxylesterase
VQALNLFNQKLVDMLLFLHGAYQSNSSFLPLIRQLLNLSSDYSDKFVLDTFTIQLPGYYSEDKKFELRVVQEQILEFIETKKQIQLDIANKLLLTKTNSAVVSLKNPKLDLVGYSAGGFLALYFASIYPNFCDSVFLLNTPLRFDGLRARWRRRLTNKDLKLSITDLQKKLEKANNINAKVFYGLLMDNTRRLGIQSYIDFMYESDFSNVFNNLTISQQHDFAKIPIFSLYGSRESLVSQKNLKALQKLLDPKNNLVSQKHTVINSSQNTSGPHFSSKKIGDTSLQMLEKNNLIQVAQELQEFLRIS